MFPCIPTLCITLDSDGVAHSIVHSIMVTKKYIYIDYLFIYLFIDYV
jgi:hypothetical protein